MKKFYRNSFNTGSELGSVVIGVMVVMRRPVVVVVAPRKCKCVMIVAAVV